MSDEDELGKVKTDITELVSHIEYLLQKIHRLDYNQDRIINVIRDLAKDLRDEKEWFNGE